VTTVLTRRCHGCPIQAIVAALGLDERTLATWLARAGQHCQPRPQPVVQQGPVDLPHGQAAELWVKLVGRRVWLALAVPSRLWLGGGISPQRDLMLLPAVVNMIRACGRSLAILVCVAGLASSVPAVRRVCRHPGRTGRPGRPRLVLEEGWLLGHMVKRYGRRRVVSVERRVVRGSRKAMAAVLAATNSGTGITTADSERLNATFRAALAPLVRRGRAIAHPERLLTAGMWLVGCAYNVCWLHDSLRVRAPAGACGKWHERTPAMAAGLTNHRWTMQELLRYHGPRPPWVAPKRRGRPPKRALHPAMAVET
jgi:hypothetical protein